MRALIVSGLLIALIAALAVARCSGDPPPPGGGGPTAARDVPAAVPLAGLPPGTVATQIERRAVPATDLAEQATAWLRVVDHDSERPIVGAAVRRVRDGAELASTDERGLAAVPLRTFEQLAVVADECLLRLAPTRPGSTEAEPQTFRLVADRWSARVRLSFRGPAGERPALVLVRFRPERDTAPSSPMPAGDPVLERAWTEHAMLAGRPVCGDVPIELGTFARDRVHRLGSEAEMRFVAAGAYTLEAATPNGWVARDRLVAEAGAAPWAVSVALLPGREVAGVVTSEATGAPLAGAAVTVEHGDPLGLVATTGVDGAFRLGPLLPGETTLHVHHVDHEPRAVAAGAARAGELRIALRPLPASTLRGRVRLRPALTPLAGATVAWQPDGRTAAAVRTGPDGTFVLRTTGSGPARLAISAPDCQPYAELVDPGAPFQDFDVWPGTTRARLDAALTAVLQGVVLDAAGAPVPGAVVRWHPRRESAPAGAPGRRVLEGAVIELPPVTTTGPDGSFALETQHLGAGRLALAGSSDATYGVEVEARPGATIQGLRLRR